MEGAIAQRGPGFQRGLARPGMAWRASFSGGEPLLGRGADGGMGPTELVRSYGSRH